MTFWHIAIAIGYIGLAIQSNGWFVPAWAGLAVVTLCFGMGAK